MDFPAAPRKSLGKSLAPYSSGLYSFALSRSMVLRSMALVLAAGLITSAAFAVTTAPVKHHKKEEEFNDCGPGCRYDNR